MELNALDRALCELLKQDARMPMADIARALAISRSTATRRLERLLEQDALRLLAETDLAAAGRDYIVVIGIKVEGQSVSYVANALADMRQSIAVNSVAGRYDIEALIAAESHEELTHLLTEKIPRIAGVGERSPSLCLEVVKFESYEVPYLP